MKKRILALALGLASPLWAIDFSASIDEVSDSNKSITVTGAKNGDFKMHTVLTLDVAAVREYISNPHNWLTNIVSLSVNSGSSNVGLSFYGTDFVAHDGTSAKKGALTTTMNTTDPANTLYCPDTVITSLENIANIFTTDVTAAVLTYSHSGYGSVGYLTVLKSDGTMVNYADRRDTYKSTGDNRYISTISYNSTLVTSADAYVVDTAISATNAFALNVEKLQQIPEPTTATLSLLALAGLAARRRRR